MRKSDKEQLIEQALRFGIGPRVIFIYIFIVRLFTNIVVNFVGGSEVFTKLLQFWEIISTVKCSTEWMGKTGVQKRKPVTADLYVYLSELSATVVRGVSTHVYWYDPYSRLSWLGTRPVHYKQSAEEASHCRHSQKEVLMLYEASLNSMRCGRRRRGCTGAGYVPLCQLLR